MTAVLIVIIVYSNSGTFDTFSLLSVTNIVQGNRQQHLTVSHFSHRQELDFMTRAKYTYHKLISNVELFSFSRSLNWSPFTHTVIANFVIPKRIDRYQRQTDSSVICACRSQAVLFFAPMNSRCQGTAEGHQQDKVDITLLTLCYCQPSADSALDRGGLGKSWPLSITKALVDY